MLVGISKADMSVDLAGWRLTVRSYADVFFSILSSNSNKGRRGVVGGENGCGQGQDQ